MLRGAADIAFELAVQLGTQGPCALFCSLCSAAGCCFARVPAFLPGASPACTYRCGARKAGRRRWMRPSPPGCGLGRVVVSAE